MAKIQWYAIAFVSFLIVAIVDVSINESTYLFLSWLLVGLLACFLIKYYDSKKTLAEFNSPHNTSIFVLGPFLFAFFMGFWGNVTGLWDFTGGAIYLGAWNLLFSYPFLLLGLSALTKCYKEYMVVYLVKTKSMSAHKVGALTSLSIIVAEIIFWIAALNGPSEFIDEPVDPHIDIFRLFALVYAGYLLLRNPRPVTVPEIPSARQSVRREVVRFRTSSQSRTTPDGRRQKKKKREKSRRVFIRDGQPVVASSSRQARRVTRSSQPARSSSSSTQVRRHVVKPTYRPQPARRVTPVPSSTARVVRGPTSFKNEKNARLYYSQFKPKAGQLSLEDFKCIFCFELPKLPDDEGRDIVICPHCKHPAHADEFLEWTANSGLCSRCDGILPPGFRRNPKRIPVKDYIEVIRYFGGKKKHR